MILTERGVEMKMYGGDKTGEQILYSQATRPCRGTWGVSQAARRFTKTYSSVPHDTLNIVLQ
jgi:hypothetical protein